ncbi:hypothetical protein CIK05_09880 [Bdellovibrio sp. qaytius]|nr:hypothetical protein CIK05_09880 [Bdellovibrio sp. qaytius]
MKNIIALLSILVIFASINAQAQYTFDAEPAPEQFIISGGTITEYQSTVIFTISGYEIESLEHLNSYLAQALRLPANYPTTFEALLEALTNSSIVARRIDVGIIGGEHLKQTIGEENHDRLLEVLNKAQDADPMHLSLIYWQ